MSRGRSSLTDWRSRLRSIEIAWNLGQIRVDFNNDSSPKSSDFSISACLTQDLNLSLAREIDTGENSGPYCERT